MRRLRLLRLIVLLAAVLVAVPVVYYLVRGRGGGGGEEARTPHRSSPHTTAREIAFTDLLGGNRRGVIDADEVEQRPDGSFRLRGIDRLEIEREGAPPLILSAEAGVIAGKPGSRTMHVEGGIEVKDDAAGMSVRLQALDWDEKVGEVRSSGAVVLTSPEMSGSASSFVYGLNGQPATLRGPDLRTPAGQRLTASVAVLHDGTRDVELTGDVKLRGPEGSLDTARLRILRPPAPAGQRAQAAGGVSGTALMGAGGPRRFRAEAMDLDWDAAGEIAHVLLRGAAELAQGEGALSADWIDAARPAGAPTEWDVQARGTVRASARGREGISRLRARELRARLVAGAVSRAEARGQVRAEGPQGTAEGDFMELLPEGNARRVRILGGDARKASLTTGRARVAGDTILIHEGSGTTVAEGRVEATLLPAEGAAKTAPSSTPFRADAPSHFVAERLEATERGDHLLFTGSVRGWQGERSLAASRVEMDQGDEALAARDRVASRLPRREGAAVSEADYVQVTSDALDYRGKEGAAAYVGNVRLRQAEGVLTAGRVDAVLDHGGRLTRAIASDNVSFDYRQAGSDGKPTQAKGKGDRAQYIPGESLVRLFGDRAPASVRREGREGGTTEGRVLRYRLDSGVLEVESGARDRGRIETSGT